MLKFFRHFVFILISLLLIGCEKDRLDVDVSDIDVQISIQRFDQELFGLNASNIVPGVEKMQHKHGAFFARYINSVISTGGSEPEVIATGLSGFLQDRNIRDLHEKVFIEYGDLSDLEDELSEAFTYYNYHFPKRSIPKVKSFVSGFNYAMVAMDSTLGVGLDMYLGSNCEYYPALGIPQYKSNVMTKEHLVVDVLKAWTMSEFEDNSKEQSLLSKMIYEGKILYLMDAFYRGKHDSLKIGFSLEQLIWCQHYEFNLWSHLVQNEILFSKNQSDVVQFTGEGPFTRGFDKTSPARTGVWLGWRIVRSYMNKHPDVTLNELMEMSDAQALLRESGYKPK